MIKHLIMGTAGHVDHGKTALIRALTGIDCDTHKEEKERGITINLGFAHLELSQDISIGIVDVPGHKDFVKTMVAGAYGIDYVLLVVAADSGIMPQTKEHFNIIKMLGINHGIVVINKADLVDEEMLELAKLEVMEFMEGSPLENAPVVAASSLTGLGIDALKTEIHKISEIIPERSRSSTFRTYIDRIFNVRGIGIVVTGSVLEGEISTGTELFLLPGSRGKLRVKGIERHGKAVETVAAGNRAALNLSGLKYEDFERGMLLSDKQLQETRMVDARIELFQGSLRLGTWSQHIFHTGTFTSKARIHLITKDEISGGESAVAQIHLEKPAILLSPDRFILRNTSSDMTIGGGMILDPQPLHHRRRTEKIKAGLELLDKACNNRDNLSDLIFFEIQKAPAPLTLSQLAEKTGKYKSDIEQAVNVLSDNIRVFIFKEEKYLVAQAIAETIKGKVVDNLKTRHEQNQLSDAGLDLREIAGKTGSVKGFDLFLLENLLNEMLDTGVLKMAGNTYALKEHKVKLDKKTAEQLRWLENVIMDSGMLRSAINEMEAIAMQNSIHRGQLIMLLKYLDATGKIFFNGDDILHESLVSEIRTKLLKKLDESPDGINEKEFRLLVNATKRIIQVLINMFLKEGIIEKNVFFLHITEKGKALI
jgi:selenocysteine-specific elongation factor